MPIVADEGEPIWNGRVLWRATTRAEAYFGGGAMVMIGHDDLRLVAYPISEPDEQGQAEINWIAEKKYPLDASWKKETSGKKGGGKCHPKPGIGWESPWPPQERGRKKGGTWGPAGRARASGSESTTP